MASGSDDQPIDVSDKIKLLDGDICSQIMRNTGTYPPLSELYGYNRNGMHNVYNAYVDFLNSGSNLIRTNTYYALYPFLQRAPFNLNDDDYIKTVKCAVQIAHESIRDYCSKKNILQSSFNIVGSCGCFEDGIIDFLSPKKLKDAHRQRINILYQNGIKILSLEGIRNFEEGQMLLDLTREFPNIKSLVIFDGNGHINSIVNWIRHFYFMHRSQIIAIGLNNIHYERAMKFCANIIKRQNTENLIPLVICTDKYGNSWNPIKVNSNAPVLEWQKFGIHYIGGGKKVLAEDILPVRKELNCFSKILENLVYN